MARPRKSTRDAWLDQFADWPVEEQETAMEFVEFIHRQTKRKAPKDDGPEEPEQRELP